MSYTILKLKQNIIGDGKTNSNGAAAAAANEFLMTRANSIHFTWRGGISIHSSESFCVTGLGIKSFKSSNPPLPSLIPTSYAFMKVN